MSDDALDVEVRREVAAAHDLSEAAVPFIGGTTLDEIEASASALAKIVNSGGRLDTHEQKPSGDLFANAASAKAARKHALFEALVGRAEQPRDERGRFVGGFDGGARTSPPPAPPSHDEWLGELLRTRRADAGVNF